MGLVRKYSWRAVSFSAVRSIRLSTNLLADPEQTARRTQLRNDDTCHARNTALVDLDPHTRLVGRASLGGSRGSFLKRIYKM